MGFNIWKAIVYVHDHHHDVTVTHADALAY